MSAAVDKENKESKGKIPSQKILLWLAIVTIVMLFAAVTSAYVVTGAEGKWTWFRLPNVFYYSTALILVSSYFMNSALSAAKKDNFPSIRKNLGLTMLFGLGFVLCQFFAWQILVQEKIFFVGTNGRASYLYFITGLHVVHVLAGIIALLNVFIKSFRNIYHKNNILALELCATYWHFMGGLWVYLFLFLLFIRNN